MSARTNAKIARPGRRKSLIGTVKHSGYELVRKRKPTRKLATMRDYAKIDFKPWKPDESGQLVPSAKTMYSLGVTARLAFATVLRTRDELINLHRKLDPAVVDEMMADLADGLERLKAIGVMVEQAYLRVLAAGAAAASRSPA